ncbi:MAG: nucleotide exchange factor GrpE, partial [Bacteroidales bacterium]
MKKRNKMNKEETQNLETENKEIEDIDSQIVEEQTEIDEFEEMARKLEEMNDKFLRLYSEFENYRKRTAKEKMEMI